MLFFWSHFRAHSNLGWYLSHIGGFCWLLNVCFLDSGQNHSLTSNTSERTKERVNYKAKSVVEMEMRSDIWLDHFFLFLFSFFRLGSWTFFWLFAFVYVNGFIICSLKPKIFGHMIYWTLPKCTQSQQQNNKKGYVNRIGITKTKQRIARMFESYGFCSEFLFFLDLCLPIYTCLNKPWISQISQI